MSKPKAPRPKDLFSTRLTVEMVEKIRNYAYWERLNIKEVAMMAFEEFFADKGEIKPRREGQHKTKPPL